MASLTAIELFVGVLVTNLPSSQLQLFEDMTASDFLINGGDPMLGPAASDWHSFTGESPLLELLHQGVIVLSSSFEREIAAFRQVEWACK